MSIFKKKQKQKWELQEIYNQAILDLQKLELVIDEAENEAVLTVARRELSDQRRFVQELAKEKREWEQSLQRTKVSADTKVAATVTGIAALAPYVIERCGKIATHLKGKVSLPRMWK